MKNEKTKDETQAIKNTIFDLKEEVRENKQKHDNLVNFFMICLFINIIVITVILAAASADIHRINQELSTMPHKVCHNETINIETEECMMPCNCTIVREGRGRDCQCNSEPCVTIPYPLPTKSIEVCEIQ